MTKAGMLGYLMGMRKRAYAAVDYAGDYAPPNYSASGTARSGGQPVDMDLTGGARSVLGKVKKVRDYGKQIRSATGGAAGVAATGGFLKSLTASPAAAAVGTAPLTSAALVGASGVGGYGAGRGLDKLTGGAMGRGVQNMMRPYVNLMYGRPFLEDYRGLGNADTFAAFNPVGYAAANKIMDMAGNRRGDM